MITIYSNKYIDKTKKSLLTFSLATIFVISSISFLVQINSIENADATVDFSNTTISSEPPTITVKPPVDEKTGQTILPPPKALVEKDPITGQTDVVANVLTKDPIREGAKVQKTTSGNDQNLGLNLEDFKEGLTLDSSAESKFQRGLFLDLQDPTTGAQLLDDKLKSAPTFNPFFRACDQAVSDVAKYSITGKLNNLRINDNDFSLNIFADLILNDAYQFDMKDKNYPYKANFVVDGDTDDPISVDLQQFNTNCIDLVTIQDPKNAIVDLDDSRALKELGFDS
jgi:hypothetical protein